MNRATMRNVLFRSRRAKGKKYVHLPMPNDLLRAKVAEIFLPKPKAPTIMENLGFTTTAKKKAKKVKL